ncbi:MAG: N-acetylmuramoyl-L-alanine amidase family protein [Thermaceae bacterium]
MVRGVWVLLLLGYALAQSPKPLLVGSLGGQAIYPGGAGVSYGEAELLARGLGLGLWQGQKEVAVSLGASVARFPSVQEEAKAPGRKAAWVQGGTVYLPLRPLAQALGLTYVAGAEVRLSLPEAQLLQVQRAENPRRLVLRFSREVNAVRLEGGVLFPLARGFGEGVRQEARGLFIPLEPPPDRIYYPGEGRAVLEWGKPPPRRPVVLLDPGHGGRDTGVDGEKDLVLDLARRVARRLSGVEVRLTRTADRGVSLEERRSMAKGAAVVLSLHAKRSPGVSLYLADTPPTRFAQSVRELLPRLSPERRALLLSQAGDGEALAGALASALASLGLAVAEARGPYAMAEVTGAGVVVEVGPEVLSSREARDALAGALAKAVLEYLR